MLLPSDFSPLQTPPPLSRPIDGLGDAKRAVFGGFAEGLIPPPPIDYTLWGSRNVQFGADDSEFDGKYDPDLFPFFREVLACLQPDHPSREVILIKSAQIGGTVVAQIFLGASMDLDPGRFGYVHPSLDNAKKWVRMKWAPFVKRCLPLRNAFASDRSRDTANSIFFKERRDGLGALTISGANSASSLSMYTVKRQVQDDLSKWEENEAGDSETQADSRAMAFSYAKIFKLSTPMIKGTCRISRNYDRSDQRAFKVPCPHCDEPQVLTWENFSKSLHEGMDYASAHFTCESCGAAIEHHHKREIVARGFWEARNPKSNIPGFWIWTAYSPLVSWARIAEKYFQVVGDPAAEQPFYNDWLGLPYEQKGEAPPWQSIAERANKIDGYERRTIPPGGILITCGVDVQGDRVEWHVKAFGPNLQRYTIDYGVIEGHISEDAARKGLDRLLKQGYRNAHGRLIGIDMLAIDANYHTEDVLDWAKQHPDNKVIAVRGTKGEFAPPLTPVQWARKKGVKMKRRQKKFFNVGVSPLKASLFKHLEKDKPEERGFCGYPRGMDDEFFIQLCSERRVLRTNKKTHYAYHEWEKLPGVRNEVLDTEIYAEAAARRLGWTELTEDRWDALRAARECAPSEQQLDLLDANLAAASNKDVIIEPPEIEEEDDDERPDGPVPKKKRAEKKKPDKAADKQGDKKKKIISRLA